MKYALLGLAFLTACAMPAPTEEPVIKDPNDVARECTRGASDRISMGEPAYIIYKDCALACNETSDPEYCVDRAKSWIELAESVNNFNESMDGL